MTRIRRILFLVVCLVLPLRLSAQSTADQIFDRIVSFEKQAEIYQSQHVQDVAEGKAQLSFFDFGVPQEITKAIIDETKSLETLASQGNVRAKHLAGILNFSKGERFWRKQDRPDWEKDIIDREFKDAQAWFRSASDDGYPLSMYMLGVMHANGQGVFQSNYVAIEWYAKAGKTFLQHNERDLALKSLEEMNKLDSNHMLAKELSVLLYQKQKAEPKRKEK